MASACGCLRIQRQCAPVIQFLQRHYPADHTAAFRFQSVTGLAEQHFLALRGPSPRYGCGTDATMPISTTGSEKRALSAAMIRS
jgi:hypothetical protein